MPYPDYPEEFSAAARARNEKVRVRRRREFEQDRRKAPPTNWTKGKRDWDERCFHVHIWCNAAAFGHEACEVGRQSIWSLDRIRRETEEFLRRFAIDAYYAYGRDRCGNQFPKMTSDGIESAGLLLPAVRQRFYDSKAGRQFENELLAVADAAVAQTEAARAGEGASRSQTRSY
jgi:hypothetical protein